MNRPNQFRISLFLCIFGVLFLQMSLAFSTSNRLFLWHNEHSLAITRADAPLAFRITSFVTSAVGLLSLAIGLAVLPKRRQMGSLHIATPGRRPSAFKGVPLWRVINILLVLLSPWTGYSTMSPTTLHGTNPDVIYCLAILVIMPLFVLGTLAVSRAAEFMKPSWDRFPLRLWSDPLQSFFIATWASFGAVLGSLLRFPEIGSVGYWTLLSHCSIFVGLLIGQAIAYYLYRARITSR